MKDTQFYDGKIPRKAGRHIRGADYNDMVEVVGRRRLRIRGTKFRDEGIDWSKIAFGTEMTSSTNLRIYTGDVEYWGVGRGEYAQTDIALNQNPAYVYVSITPGSSTATVSQASTKPSMTDDAAFNMLLCLCTPTDGVYVITRRYRAFNITIGAPKV